MEAAFWHQKWADNQIGFHQAQANPYLQRYWPGLGLAAGSRVLVPLCGKSLDMAWLAGQGYRVRGIELSRRAVEDFFQEQGLQAQVWQQGAFEVWCSGEVELWCGDFFALRAEDVADCVGLYDRAALIALPPQMRERYMGLLSQILPVGSGLLVTLDYEQKLLAGPPFSVADEEVRRGFAGWQVEEVEARDVIGESPKFLQAGVKRLVERVYRVQF
ncbi:thiopurine S-methyltransferase [Pseudomonas putida]|jgi:thiopurine S-methyltransferase|uniref:Thiopurine S-methyltransferase n=1 Tax=Pseudomonas putida (strain W619) TaxID=390235 RepID=TPMT_PSEPW|nr:thiopurine S-methyltransferase [Pseudomonas putida]B1J4W2.1 RecName: Full=Thiopurine S-methyltransferase; AltName: Full=Thiopurine methyltransferase [Pseudomonas putida W619]QQE85514.1 thiopurine S-methyltransferase [Pseudomonas putida]UTL82527.1 thiopurine S-methyltransferase [Pseudomonas putida]